MMQFGQGFEGAAKVHKDQYFTQIDMCIKLFVVSANVLHEGPRHLLYFLYN